MKMHSPLHPGVFIKQTFLYELGISRTELSKQLKVARSTVSRLVEGKSDVSIEMAQRLSLGLHGSAEFWVNMQGNYDLWKARNNTYKKIDRKWLDSHHSATIKRVKRKAQKKVAA